MDKQREDFEAWVREYGNYPRRPELKTSDGAYHYLHTESEWRAWQAAQLAAAQGQVPQAWTNVLAYALQDDLHNRLTPRVIDIAYSAFMQAKQPNKEDGGASDWFNDTKPMVNELIAKLRKDLVEEFGDAPIPQPPAPSDAAFVKACRDELAKRKPEPAAETVGGLAKAVKAARGGDAPPAPMRRFA